ncbi:MAG TPA: hypothetical protein DEB46_00865 [Myxococcales bacterium]|jgi:hypothetical protein|nr:hypothetical protein [Myxococcales bacterium]HBU46834.1 hypothetical protein [Myxococcales bacterium]
MKLRPFVYENFLRKERRLIFARNWPEAMAIGLDCLESPCDTLMVRCSPAFYDDEETVTGG